MDKFEGVEQPPSDGIGRLALALSKAQAVMEGASKDATNPHYKSTYATLASVWDACRAPLSANGLAVVQLPSADGKVVTVHTQLIHSSGERLVSSLSAEARDPSPQAVGSTITYLRRYSLAAMVGIAPEDDDGETAQPSRQYQQQYRPPETKAPPALQRYSRAAEAADGIPTGRVGRTSEPVDQGPPPNEEREPGMDLPVEDDFRMCMKSAQSIEELTKVGLDIAKQPEALRKKLKPAYAERLKELTAEAQR